MWDASQGTNLNVMSLFQTRIHGFITTHFDLTIFFLQPYSQHIVVFSLSPFLSFDNRVTLGTRYALGGVPSVTIFQECRLGINLTDSI